MPYVVRASARGRGHQACADAHEGHDIILSCRPAVMPQIAGQSAHQAARYSQMHSASLCSPASNGNVHPPIGRVCPPPVNIRICLRAAPRESLAHLFDVTAEHSRWLDRVSDMRAAV